MANSAEGKRLALCDLCDKNIPAKYCQTCNGSLCTQYVEDHSKTRIFKGHTVTDLPANDITQSRFKSGEAESGLSKCPKHLAKELDSFCKTCSCFICTDCKSSHGGHTIQSAKDDIQLYHSMCRKHIQGLLDGVHELEEYKQLIDKVFYVYDEATGVVDEWEIDLLDHVRDKATKLREELKSEKNEWIKILENLKTEAANIQENADKEINNLNEVRKSQEYEILSQKLAETQKLLTQLSRFKQKIKTKPEVPKVDTLLPNVSAIPKAKEDIDIVFTKSASNVSSLAAYFINTGPEGDVIHDLLRLQHDIAIQKPKTRNGYRICRGRLGNNIILHGLGLNPSDIRALNLDEMNIEEKAHQCKVDIFNMASLNGTTCIAKNNKENELQVLDNNFAILSVMKPEIGHVRSISHAYNGRLVTLEKKKDSGFVNYMTVKKGKLRYEVSVPVDGDTWEIGMHPDKQRCILFSKGNIHKVERNRGSVSSFNALNPFYFPQCIAVDTKFIYTATGQEITAIDHSHNAKRILNVGRKIRDMVIDNGKIIVSTADNHILIYY